MRKDLNYMTLILVLCISNASAKSNPKNIDPLRVLKAGEILVTTRNVEGSTWPEVQFKAFIHANTLQSVAVFAAYNHQQNYVPDVIKSMALMAVSPTDIHVQYERDMPWPLSNSRYVTGNKIRKSDDTYQVSWYFVSSDVAKDTNGHAEFEPTKDGTIFTYTNHVVPDSIFATFFEGSMIKDTRKTVQAIIDHIEELVKKDPRKVQELEELITGALAGKDVYFANQDTESMAIEF